MRKFAIIALLLSAPTAWAMNGDKIPVTVTKTNGTVPLTLEYVTTPPTREYGLMNRTELAPNGGMIFVFPRTGRLAFWMKNTKIPLDMLFIDEQGTIIHIATNATPESLTPIDSFKPVKSVIELVGGDAARDNIHEGDKVSYQLPAGTHVE